MEKKFIRVDEVASMLEISEYHQSNRRNRRYRCGKVKNANLALFIYSTAGIILIHCGDGKINVSV